jgi:hypothetical protein
MARSTAIYRFIGVETHGAVDMHLSRLELSLVLIDVTHRLIARGVVVIERQDTSFQGRKKPNGSACQRRTTAGVQDEAKHAVNATSPLKSCEVENPQPQR